MKLRHSSTRLAQALGADQNTDKGIIPPIHIATTYLRDPDNQYRSGYSYGRPHNPTIQQAESVIAGLEQGSDAMLFGSGMAAATAVFLSCQAGDHVIAPKVMYWSLRKWLVERSGLDVTFVDMDRPGAVSEVIRAEKTRVVWVETPANPLWVLTDISATADVAHQAGAILVVDSTVVTPLITQPLAHGADLVMHSVTKYLNGHSDVLAGVLVTANQDEYWKQLQQQRSDLGSILSPRDGAQLLRGMRTLHLRVKESCQSAMRIAEFCIDHAGIANVLYPGLPSHPQHELACRQMKNGFGGMLSIQLTGGEQAAIDLAASLCIWKIATSLGGVESLVEHRASVEGIDSPVPLNLLRLSVGIEDCEDLIDDLRQGLDLLN
ncbi:MAG: cystathionine gamma-synthase [Gammaproteobacteria bacterium]|jgi:cystathionine gamma-synthase